MNNHLGLKISTIALSIMLASCGGGGSKGYYENSNSGEGNQEIDQQEQISTSQLNSLRIDLDKNSLVAINGNLVVTV